MKWSVVQPSASALVSPVVLRFCIDYKRLNSVMKKDVYPLPRVLAGMNYFTSLDMASRYWQAELEPESQPMSAFIIHRELNEFIRMPFGMCNAPATFQRAMEIILTGLIWKNCIDDVLVCSRMFYEHLIHVFQQPW